MEVVKLLTEIYDKAVKESAVLPIGRKFVSQYIPQLLNINKLELLSSSFKNFDLGENTSFLLSVPEIWEPMKLEDWADLIKLMSPRPTVNFFDPTGHYSDVVFFTKWLKLDGLQFVLSLKDLKVEDKRQICQYCRIKAHFLQNNPEDLEDLDGEIFCSASNLLSYRTKLLAQDGRISPNYSDESSFQNYVDDIYLQLFDKPNNSLDDTGLSNSSHS